MTVEMAIRASEVLLALAIAQASAEHLAGPSCERLLFALRLPLAGLLSCGVGGPWVLAALFATSVLALIRFDGPYNGGSDKMGLLITVCLLLAHSVPAGVWQEQAMGYLAVQVVLSYFISGQVKLMNSAWRNGTALRDVFVFSAYPVSTGVRQLAERPQLLLCGSWAVILLELVFPLALLSPVSLYTALVVAGSFHLANAVLFGLNRFLWTWIAAYPSLIWLQGRLFGGLW